MWVIDVILIENFWAWLERHTGMYLKLVPRIVLFLILFMAFGVLTNSPEAISYNLISYKLIYWS